MWFTPPCGVRSALPLHGLGGTMRVAAVPPAAAARTAAAATGTSATTRPTAATGTWRLGVRNLHSDPPAVELAAVELRDRVLGLLGSAHLDKAESPGLAGETVGDHSRRQDIAALSKEFPEPFAGRGVCETADIQFGCHLNPLRLSSALLHAPRTRKA